MRGLAFNRAKLDSALAVDRNASLNLHQLEKLHWFMIGIRLSVGMLRTTERESVLVVGRYKYNGRSIVKGSRMK